MNYEEFIKAVQCNIGTVQYLCYTMFCSTQTAKDGRRQLRHTDFRQSLNNKLGLANIPVTISSKNKASQIFFFATLLLPCLSSLFSSSPFSFHYQGYAPNWRC